MSFNVPRHVPSFTAPQRELEDRLWPSSGVSSRRAGASSSSSLGSKVGGLLHPERSTALPMYKDKPYGYPASHRAKPVYRRKRTFGILFLLAVALMWFFGAFDGHKDRFEGRVRGWGWLKDDKGSAKSTADWMRRRERVVEAFELSWDAYSRYAWGE